MCPGSTESAYGMIGVLQCNDADRFVTDRILPRFGEVRSADLVVLVTGYASRIEPVGRCFGDNVAGAVGQVWASSMSKTDGDGDGEIAALGSLTGLSGPGSTPAALVRTGSCRSFLAQQVFEEGLIRAMPLETFDRR